MPKPPYGDYRVDFPVRSEDVDADARATYNDRRRHVAGGVLFLKLLPLDADPEQETTNVLIDVKRRTPTADGGHTILGEELTDADQVIIDINPNGTEQATLTISPRLR